MGAGVVSGVVGAGVAGGGVGVAGGGVGVAGGGVGVAGGGVGVAGGGVGVAGGGVGVVGGGVGVTVGEGVGVAALVKCATIEMFFSLASFNVKTISGFLSSMEPTLIVQCEKT